ncbi:Uncharacterised protein [Legionella donaldsonii]|uniref:Uncharacterized protein n=1 Tax=Legionella donaldsonii TaxID=45060 RepID=A0A378J1H8_9GAMM|nr:Uncharacterised protein [Legionella donaldsonii]
MAVFFLIIYRTRAARQQNSIKIRQFEIFFVVNDTIAHVRECLGSGLVNLRSKCERTANCGSLQQR